MMELQSFLASPTVSTGYSHKAFLLPSGEVYTSGANESGQLGIGSKATTRLTHRISIPDTITKVVCRGRHTLMITVDGSVYGCGANHQRALGIGDQGSKTTLTRMLLDLPARDIVTSMLHTLILLQDGTVFICGHSGHNIVYHTPVKILLPLPAVSIACNADTGFALLEDDSIYGWGNNTLG